MEKKFFKIIIMAIMLVLVYSTVVNALSFTPTMTPSQTTVAESTELTVTVKITNLDVGTNGINSFSAKLDYDTTVFETLNASSVDGLSGWSATYDPETKLIVLTKLQFVNTEESLFQITLKTKSGVTGKTGTIKLTEVVAADPTNKIEAQDVSTSIAVGTVANNTANTTNNGTNNNVPVINANVNSATNTNTNNTTNNTSNNTANKVNNVANNTAKNNVVNNATSDDEIPYTGTEDTIIKAIFVVMAVALIFYIKFEKINKEMK